MEGLNGKDIKNCQSWVEIDAKALRHNFKVFQNLIGKKSVLMAVIKSNAYGHGILETAAILKNSAKWFGVFSPEEALFLKGNGFKNNILVLGYAAPRCYKNLARNNISFTIASVDSLEKLCSLKFSGSAKPKVHIKIETGFNRQGLRFKELGGMIKLLKNSNIEVEGIYTHFCDIANAKSKFWKNQLNTFQKAIFYFEEHGICPPFIHSAATAAAVLHPETRFNMARIGIGLYGYFPSADIKIIKKNLKLKPALSWRTRIIQLKIIKKGESVGYERKFFARKKMKVAVLPVGYWDGYDRKLSNKGEVFIRGRYCRVLGIVSMNMMVVDLTNSPKARVGDEVLLLGVVGDGAISAFEIAKKAGTIPYEVLARINPLVPRIVVRDGT